MEKSKTWVAMVGTTLIVALMAVSGTGCGKEDERALRRGRAAEARGDWQIAEKCYERAAALDNAEGARRLAELLVKYEGASLFGASRKHDAAWVAQAEAWTDHIGTLLRTAQARGEKVDELEGTLNSYTAAIHRAKKTEEERRRAEEAEEANEFRNFLNLLSKAKRAEEDGLISFYGFYVGMPEEDAFFLTKHYGLKGNECELSIIGKVVGQLEFSLDGISRCLTKEGSNFEKLAQAVANHIGDLQWKSHIDECGFGRYYEYETIDGHEIRLFDKDLMTMGGELKAMKMSGGEQLKARIRNEQASSLAGAVEEASKKTSAVLGAGSIPGETKTLTWPGAWNGEVKMEMVWCPPGTFMMGSPQNEEGRDHDETQHQVTLTKGFWMAKYEVTRGQWWGLMRQDPSRNTGEGEGPLPVDSVSWYDCMEFCRVAGLRLPTEAEWEYACRAGSTGPYAGTGRLAEMGWGGDGGLGKKTHPVGQKQANAWGLHDMHGNVEEWCADGYGEYPGAAVTDPSTREAAGGNRVLRGGGVSDYAWDCRSADRQCLDPAYKRGLTVGFRPCCSAGSP